MATTTEDATAAAAPSPALGAPTLGLAAPPSDPPGERRVLPADATTALNLEGAPPPTPQPQSPNPSSPQHPPSTPTTIRVGGPNGSQGVPAYALLAGVLEPTHDLVALPLTRLPATLGKEHETRDRGFVGLPEPPAGEGASKGKDKLSKSMAVVYYRDRSGGRLGHYKKSKHSGGGEVMVDAGGADLDGMTYKPHVVDAGDENENKKAAAGANPDDIVRPSGNAAGSLPSNGFYAIECACRAILVNGRPLKKGQSAVLEHGTPIRIGPYCLYFLLPRQESAAAGGPPMLRLRTASPAKGDNEEGDAAASPAKASAKAVAKATVVEAPPGPEANAAGEATTNPKAGEKTKSSGGGSAKKEEGEAAAAPPKKKPKKSTKQIEASLDAQSDVELLAFLARKVTQDGPWDQEGQKLGAALAVRACRAAARSPSVQRLVRAEGGATQRDLVAWMTSPESPFRDYERLMLRKIEKKSFMMGVGKAIVRAGYAKNEAKSGAGRANRWLLPGMAPPTPTGAAAETEGGGAVVAPLGGGVAAPAPAKAAEEAKANAAPSPAAGGGVANTDVPREPTAAPGGETTTAP